MIVDFHAHFDTEDPEKVRAFVDQASANGVVTAFSGGTMGSNVYADAPVILKYCREYPDWLIPVYKVDLEDHECDLANLRRMRDQGFKALKIIYPYHAYDHDLYMPFYEECERLGMPLLFHTGEYRPCRRDREIRRPMLTNMRPLTMDRIARSFPDLHIVMAHLGTGTFRHEAASILKLHPNVYSDLGGNGAWQAVSPEELGRLLGPLVLKRDATGAFFNKLVFGSDCYVTYPEIQQGALKYYGLDLVMNDVPQEIRKNIMGGTIARWLDLKP